MDGAGAFLVGVVRRLDIRRLQPYADAKNPRNGGPGMMPTATQGATAANRNPKTNSAPSLGSPNSNLLQQPVKKNDMGKDLNFNNPCIKHYREFLDSEYQKMAVYFSEAIYYAFKDPLDFLSNQPRRTAMILLLDKSYSAGLNRHSRHTEKKMPFALWEVSVKLAENVDYNTRMTEILKQAAAMDGKLNEENLETGIALVERFKALLSEVNGTGHKQHSFAPKFLHFVSQAIPPWDNIAKEAMAVAMGCSKSRMFDYSEYAKAFFYFFKSIHSQDSFTCEQVKALDNYLLCWGRALPYAISDSS